MRIEDITRRLKRYGTIAVTTNNVNIHNMCMNRISVLELMLDRWSNEWYDEESDFVAQYQNTVDDLIEQENDISNHKIDYKEKVLFT